MLIKIEIECESIRELLQHLQELSMQITIEALQKGLGDGGHFRKNTTFEDSNCYGAHSAVVKEEYL